MNSLRFVVITIEMMYHNISNYMVFNEQMMQFCLFSVLHPDEHQPWTRYEFRIQLGQFRQYLSGDHKRNGFFIE